MPTESAKSKKIKKFVNGVIFWHKFASNHQKTKKPQDTQWTKENLKN